MGEQTGNTVRTAMGTTAFVLSFGILIPGTITFALIILAGANWSEIPDSGWNWPDRNDYKSSFAVSSPLLLGAGALVQASLAAAPAGSWKCGACGGSGSRDIIAVLGWGFVVVGAALSAIAAVLPVA